MAEGLVVELDGDDVELPPDLPEGLAELLQEVFSDPEFRAEIQERAKQKALNDIAWVKGYLLYGNSRGEDWQKWAMLCVETGAALFEEEE